ncbi:phosphate ABC transporter permease PstA [Roseovarius salinarum]|uniref:phosphate ABC transporter permease PstA n=1 Tax=Roseovarius salinarum TaxID=1981892 RepID=UPI000C320E43|nr:phosphate ABC transporter permease PstA [Roseovarius salinarum]
MTDRPENFTEWYTSERFNVGVRRRRTREGVLRGLGMVSILLAVTMLVTLFGSIFYQARTAFVQTQIGLEVALPAAEFDGGTQAGADAIKDVNFRGLVADALYASLGGRPDSRGARREMLALISADASFQLMERVIEEPSLIGQQSRFWLPASDDMHNIVQGVVDRDVTEDDRRTSDAQINWIERLEDQGMVRSAFAWDLLLRNDSRDPEVAGIFAGVVGSALMLTVTLVVSLPLGVAAAVYLEEFAPKNWFTRLIDVNIRNLAAVPSIVFGLLALAVFIRVFGMPRSSPLVGGLALSLLTLPTMIIAARAAIAAVPPSLRTAAMELGASKMQTVSKVVLPNALPGILTGTIISMAEALGETAPLLMIGMVAFVADAPSSFLDPAAPLPVQIYTWSTSPERAFAAKTAAAIIVLLLFLFLMNAAAIYLRDRVQKKW